MNIEQTQPADPNKPEEVRLEQIRPTPENPKGYFTRHWPIILAFVVLLVVALTDKVFSIAGTLIYIPVLALLSFLCAGGLRRFFNRGTTESDARDGTHDRLWDLLSDADALKSMPAHVVHALIVKVVMHKLEVIAYFLAAAIIAAACIK